MLGLVGSLFETGGGSTGEAAYKGAWNASSNTPTLADGTGANGDFYRVSVSGTQNLGSGNISFTAGNLVIYNGSIWQQAGASISPSGLAWNVVTSTTQNISVNNGYIARSATSVDFTLPATASIGDIFEILYRSPNPGQLLQNASQTIIAGDQQTIVGSGGKIDSINNGEVLVIRCTNTNTEFMVISPVGNFNVA
jgi:hypothetical protein